MLFFPPPCRPPFQATQKLFHFNFQEIFFFIRISFDEVYFDNSCIDMLVSQSDSQEWFLTAVAGFVRAQLSAPDPGALPLAFGAAVLIRRPENDRLVLSYQGPCLMGDRLYNKFML